MADVKFEERLSRHAADFHPVIPFEKSDRFLLMDFTGSNTELNDEILSDTDQFIHYINRKLESAGVKYGIGGYNEHRAIYSRSRVFDAVEGEEPRRLHLGIDIWGKPYTKVMAPLDGIVHSFGFHNAFGDYGTTIILTHQLDGETFHTLYGHLSLNSIKNLQEGDLIKKGEVLGEFGIPFENGHWPPHLHFQVIKNMEGMKGDYPGVCRFSERNRFLANCPDGNRILNIEY